jgi:hypothetical protein
MATINIMGILPLLYVLFVLAGGLSFWWAEKRHLGSPFMPTALALCGYFFAYSFLGAFHLLGNPVVHWIVARTAPIALAAFAGLLWVTWIDFYRTKLSGFFTPPLKPF